MVALWKDPVHGTREIHASGTAEAIVLDARVVHRTAWTADGRSDDESTLELVLAPWAIRPVFLPGRTIDP